MQGYRLHRFGLDHLTLEDLPEPQAGPDEVCLEVRAVGLNYRDLLVIRGQYNPQLPLPAVPISDAAGVVTAVGAGVNGVAVGDHVMTHFVADWIDGPFRGDLIQRSLGTPGPGMAARRVALPAHAVLPLPRGYSFTQAATLPIAALTAWSALFTVGNVSAGDTVLTLGTGGVSIFTLQLAVAAGATLIITSSSDAKLARATALGAQHTINYRAHPDWDKAVLDATDGAGADLTVETGGAGTLDRSMKATRSGGTVAVLGALTGVRAPITTALILMKRLHLAGIYVDSRASFVALCRFIEQHHITPIIDRTFGFDELPDALRHLETGTHFGKVVVEYA